MKSALILFSLVLVFSSIEYRVDVLGESLPALWFLALAVGMIVSVAWVGYEFYKQDKKQTK